MVGSWQIRLAVFSCTEVYCICFHCMEAALSGSLKGMGYLKTENRVRAYRTHPTSGLEVSCGLRLAGRISRYKSPATWMTEADHRKTASWGSWAKASQWRSQQAKLIDKGKFGKAMEMDIRDIKRKFGKKYNIIKV